MGKFRKLEKEFEKTHGKIGAGTYGIGFIRLDGREDETMLDLEEGGDAFDLYLEWMVFCHENLHDEESAVSIKRASQAS